MRRTRELLFGEDTAILEVLTTPINKLGLMIEGAGIEDCISELNEDLDEVGIKLRPNFYISHEYGCCENTSNVAVAFYDLEERVKQIRLDVKGEYNDKDAILLLLKHETGHAFCYSYKLYEEEEFRGLFKVKGDFYRTYPKTNRYKPNPRSKDYVNPSGDHYAQKHADDDFAETFATWLDRKHNWRRLYKHKPGALRKLKYVGKVIRQHGKKRVKVKNDPNDLDAPIEKVSQTVAQFYKVRLTKYRMKATGFVDDDLKEIACKRIPRKVKRMKLSQLIKENRRPLSEKLIHWSGVNDFVVKDLLDKVINRSSFLELDVDEKRMKEKLIEVTSYLSILTTDYARTGNYITKP